LFDYVNGLPIYSFMRILIQRKKMTPAKNVHDPSAQEAAWVRCHGCGGRATELGKEEAVMLRREFTDARSITARAFECPTCEAVIFEDEFTLGKFVPPQFRHMAESNLIATSPGLGAFSIQFVQSGDGEMRGR
jgi:hypothetical protein